MGLEDSKSGRGLGAPLGATADTRHEALLEKTAWPERRFPGRGQELAY